MNKLSSKDVFDERRPKFANFFENFNIFFALNLVEFLQCHFKLMLQI